MPLKSNASSATMLDFQERILEIDEADSHIPTATTTKGMNISQNPSNQNPEK
jgi:hypothetical protein